MSSDKSNNIKKTKITEIINLIIFFVFLSVTALLLIFLERPDVSEIENRKLTSLPEFTAESFFSGKYTEQLSKYFNDTVPGRDYFKKAASNIKNLSGFALNNVEIYGNLKPISEIENDYEDISITAIEVENTTAPIIEADILTTTEKADVLDLQTEQTIQTDDAIVDEPADTTGTAENNVITVEFYDEYTPIVAFQNGHWRGISMYYGGKGTAYAESVNEFKQDLGDEINVYSMIAPTSGAFYTPESYSQYNASQSATLDSIRSMLIDVLDVDCHSALNMKKDEDIYTRTDHHWQPLGAYYAAKEFAAAAGVPFAELSEYTPVVIPDYVGTMYGYTNSANLMNDSEDFIYYKPNNDYTAYYYTTDYVFEYEFPLFVQQPLSQSYSTFMGGDAKIVRIETDVKNGRKLAVLKDSYGNAEIPFYTSSFEEIFVIDIRYFNLNAIDFIKEHKVTDVLFTMCIFSIFEPNVSCIERIRTN